MLSSTTTFSGPANVQTRTRKSRKARVQRALYCGFGHNSIVAV